MERQTEAAEVRQTSNGGCGGASNGGRGGASNGGCGGASNGGPEARQTEAAAGSFLMLHAALSQFNRSEEEEEEEPPKPAITSPAIVISFDLPAKKVKKVQDMDGVG